MMLSYSEQGSPLKELMQVLPSLSKDQVQTLIRELKAEDKIFNKGKTRAALWYLKQLRLNAIKRNRKSC